MAFSKQLTTVTTFSKFLALILFFLLPVLGFLFGMNYQRLLIEKNQPGDQITCTMDAKICPDGSSVGRTGPNCEFSPCPNFNENDQKYICPETGYVDCMPGPESSIKTECEPQYLQWAQENCPGFKGGAL